MITLAKLFKNEDLLVQSLTHRSWVNEHKGERKSNERFEFLGDAVLQIIVSKEIFKKFPDKDEGYLTALRASLVNAVNLSRVANKLNLGDLMYLSKGEEKTGGRTNKSLLSDTVEALIGALFLDQGLPACEKLISEYILTDLAEKVKAPLKDSKSLLQEYVQKKGFKPPTYKVANTYGPDHAKTFVVEVIINGNIFAQAMGNTKDNASQSAASTALLRLKRA